jgi:hypothetical protein
MTNCKDHRSWENYDETKWGLPELHCKEICVDTVLITCTKCWSIYLKCNYCQLASHILATTQTNSCVNLSYRVTFTTRRVVTREEIPKLEKSARSIINELIIDIVPRHASYPFSWISSRYIIGFSVFNPVFRITWKRYWNLLSTQTEELNWCDIRF